MSDLTDRQSEILRFVRDCMQEHGAPPTRADIARAFGFSSPNAAERHLRAIAAKGHIEMSPGASRNIRLTGSAQEALSAPFQLPLIGRIAAGSPITAPDNIEDHVMIDPGLFHPRADFLHRVAGHSMREAGILDGDIVGIHHQPVADNGEIVAAVLWDRKTGDDRITLKRYSRRGSRVVLKSENSGPGYEPIEIDLAAAGEDEEKPQFRIAGVYAGLIRIPR